MRYLRLFLESISLFKYSPMLYFNKKDTFSTWQGGLLSIFQLVITMWISVSVLYSPFQRDTYTLTQDTVDYTKTDLWNIKAGEVF